MKKKILILLLGSLTYGSVQADNLEIPIIEIVSDTNYQINQRIDPEVYERSLRIQETSPGQQSPYVGPFTGNQVNQTVNGITFSNHLFRTGPNQYFGWIPNEFVGDLSISDGGNVGGTINRTLRVKPSHLGFKFNSANKNFTETTSYKKDGFGIMLSNTKTDNVRTADGEIANSSFNKRAVLAEAEWNPGNTTQFFYSESDDLKRTDKWNGGYRSSGYQSPKVYTWEKQQFTFLNHTIKEDKWDINLAFQNHYEKILDNNKQIDSNNNIFNINVNYWINQNWSIYSTNMLERINFDNGVSPGSSDDKSDTFKQGLRWSDNIGPIDITLSGGSKQVRINGFDTFNAYEGSAIFGYNGFFTSFDYSTNAPSYYMLKQSLTTGRGTDLPNPSLDQERAITWRTGYKNQNVYFDIYRKWFKDAFYSNQISSDVSQTVNSGDADVYGSTISYRTRDLFNTGIGFDSRLEYAYGEQSVYGTNIREPMDKTAQLVSYMKFDYAKYYVEWLYQPEDNALSRKDKNDVRIWNHNNGYNLVNLGYGDNYKNLNYRISINNLFNNDGRILGSSVDVPGRSLFFSLEYNF